MYEEDIGNNSGTTLDNLVQTGNFCNDISDSFHSRHSSNSPIFTCPNDGVMINSKAGIITADEIMYSGGSYNKGSITHLDSDKPFMTITSSYTKNNYLIFWASYYKSFDSTINAKADGYTDSIYYRPVINLKPDVTIKSGNGTEASPYVIG